MKILVSGSSGFVGQNIMKFLQPKVAELIGISRRPQGDNQIDWDTFFLNYIQSDVFIHLAGKAHDVKHTTDADEYFKINTEFTKRVFDVFLRNSAHTFIFMSSVKAVKDTVDGVLTEDTTPDPKTPYGQSKLMAEEYICNKILPEGKRVFILRPCMIHGPGNKGNLNLLYKFLQKGIPYPLAAFTNQRSFLSISNLSYIIERIIFDVSIPGGIYNLADDVALSTNDLIEILGNTAGLKKRAWRINPSVIKSAALVGDVLRLPFSSERLKKLTENYVVSNKRIKRALGIKQLPLSSIEGLQMTIKSFNEK